MTMRPEPFTFLQQLSALCRTDLYGQKRDSGYRLTLSLIHISEPTRH